MFVDGLARVRADELRVGAVGVGKRSRDHVEIGMTHGTVGILHRRDFLVARGRLESRQAGLKHRYERRLIGYLMNLEVLGPKQLDQIGPAIFVEQLLVGLRVRTLHVRQQHHGFLHVHELCGREIDEIFARVMHRLYAALVANEFDEFLLSQGKFQVTLEYKLFNGDLISLNLYFSILGKSSEDYIYFL